MKTKLLLQIDSIDQDEFFDEIVVYIIAPVNFSTSFHELLISICFYNILFVFRAVLVLMRFC